MGWGMGGREAASGRGRVDSKGRLRLGQVREAEGGGVHQRPPGQGRPAGAGGMQTARRGQRWGRATIAVRALCGAGMRGGGWATTTALGRRGGGGRRNGENNSKGDHAEG